jgi:hypothetical protein
MEDLRARRIIAYFLPPKNLLDLHLSVDIFPLGRSVPTPPDAGRQEGGFS